MAAHGENRWPSIGDPKAAYGGIPMAAVIRRHRPDRSRILIVVALVGSIAVSPLPWALVIILALFAVPGRGVYRARRGSMARSRGICGSRRWSSQRLPVFGSGIYGFGSVRRR
jgi:uncharacterized membrane protein YdbT with pleckstrin-like domain